MLLLLSGASALVAWYFTSKSCVSDAEECAKGRGLSPDNIFDGFDLDSVRSLIEADSPAEAFCKNVLPDNIDDCEFCYHEGADCFKPTFNTFIAGVVMLALSVFVLPCWCCWCSSQPDNVAPY
jgi:hypothetical protein